MKIEKAIEILGNHQCDLPRNEVPDLIAALQLGIEALKRIKVEREHFSMSLVLYIGAPLPGEIEE